MPIQLNSFAEKQAVAAQSLPAFQGLNLYHIKSQVAQLLGLIGRDGIFDQYTKHDISHIDGMLGILEWIIPDEAKSAMSTADWLLTVLSVYFHDLGLLVTTSEFKNRRNSGFSRFCEEVLFAGQEGKDYKARVKQMTEDESERFLYQEFVRHHHATRIKAWLSGAPGERFGVAHETVDEVDRLLGSLRVQIRKDLGLICESHHLNDLGDISKYRIVQPYGNSDAETANLQYCAVLLRTADLLHITADRTPSIEFRVLSPTDPVSQQEWAKQMAVTRVMPKLGSDEEGQPDEKAPRDTIEVHAYFTDENGFFGLTTYLAYAGSQLRKSHEWITATQKTKKVGHVFPWRKIDDTNIATDGFLRETFEFTIDQAKILDLLTGHTLYNDTKVVLRELVQNSIDAIRVYRFEHGASGASKVSINWDSKNRLLSVQDDGTGMSQKIISNFLLRVGSSRYQDPDFKKNHPGFSSISRFGIGVLSAFMIADGVEIVTVSDEDEQARHLTLRSVHGKYLIRLLDKDDPVVKPLGRHGTRFQLKVRPSVEIANILDTAKLWVVIPGCEVKVTTDGGEGVTVGHKDAATALQAVLKERGIDAEISNATEPPEQAGSGIRIFSQNVNKVNVAYAVKWSEYFKEWTFLPTTDIRRTDEEPLLLGTCIEGVRVEVQTPGFENSPIAALANVSGENAPRTNVARSGIEVTPERDQLLSSIYGVYMAHVRNELRELCEKRNFSLTWAIREARYILNTLIGSPHFRRDNGPVPSSRPIFNRALAELPVFSLERVGQREAVSVKELEKLETFWTIDCSLLTSVEPLIKEAKTSTSASAIVSALRLDDFPMPPGPLLCGGGPEERFENWVFSNREISDVVINAEHRRIDLCWARLASPHRWGKPSDKIKRMVWNFEGLRQFVKLTVCAARESVKVTCNGQQPLAVRSEGTLYLLPRSSLSRYLLEIFDRAENGLAKDMMSSAFACFVVESLSTYRGHVDNARERISNLARRFERGAELGQLGLGDVRDWYDLGQLVGVIEETSWNIFDPSRWVRSKRDGFTVEDWF